mgnify:CR=1 FL=1
MVLVRTIFSQRMMIVSVQHWIKNLINTLILRRKADIVGETGESIWLILHKRFSSKKSR